MLTCHTADPYIWTINKYTLQLTYTLVFTPTRLSRQLQNRGTFPGMSWLCKTIISIFYILQTGDKPGTTKASKSPYHVSTPSTQSTFCSTVKLNCTWIDTVLRAVYGVGYLLHSSPRNSSKFCSQHLFSPFSKTNSETHSPFPSKSLETHTSSL